MTNVTPESRSFISAHPAIRLLPTTNEKYDSTSRFAPWRQGHIAAVRSHVLDPEGALVSENAILALLEGLDAFATAITDDDEKYGPWASEEFAPALYAAASLLSLDLGRLDGGVLDAWLGELFERIGWNRNLNTHAEPS